MPTVGLGVREIRVHLGDAYRVIYVAKFILGGVRVARVPEEITEDVANGSGAGAAQVQVARPGQEAAVAEKMKYVRGSDNIFVDLGFGKAEAENLKMRADLTIQIVQFYRNSGMTQAAAAKALGLTQPRLNALLKGKIGLFSLDALVNIATKAGLNVRLVVKKAA